MFGLLKMLFYTCIAVVVGVFIGTVPVGGRTIADRITSAYRDLPGMPSVKSEPARPARRERAAPAPKAATRSARPAPVAVASASAPAPVTAGAANSPDAHTPEQRAALERLIANRAKR